MEALDAKDMKRRVLYTIGAGFFIGLHAAAWAAWWFIYLIVFFALIGYLGFTVVKYAFRKQTYVVWKDSAVKNAAIIFIVFYLAAFIFSVGLASDVSAGSYLGTPKLALSKSSNLDRAVENDSWPNVLTTVAELNKSSFSGAVKQLGKPLFFFGCLIGLLLLIMPRNIREWHWEQWTLFGVGALISIYLLNADGVGRLASLALLGLPIGLILLVDIFRGYDVDVATSLVVLVWFLATVYATYSGVRFILLIIPVYGITFAVTAGRIYEWVTEYGEKEFKKYKYIVHIVVFILIASALSEPVDSGYDTAKGFVPSIDDAWWDTLTKIKHESAPDAIINSWWDFGHWFKFVADRRVSADGTTQGTHVPHWLGKALVTSDERESIGILRMLDCGSDYFGKPEGKLGAYWKATQHTGEYIFAHDLVLEVVNRDKAEAREYLLANGFTEEKADDMLVSTHCEAPENYFITSGDMVGKSGGLVTLWTLGFQKSILSKYIYDSNHKLKRLLSLRNWDILTKRHKICSLKQRASLMRDKSITLRLLGLDTLLLHGVADVELVRMVRRLSVG